MNVTTEVEEITPVRAEQYLDTMRANRKLSSQRVSQLANQMREGLWVFDGSPIRFNEDGELVDGQHRMWAIIESERPAEFLVLRGVNRKAMATMDTGKSRSFSDILGLNNPGLTDVTTVAAFVQLLWRTPWGGAARRRGLAKRDSERRSAGILHPEQAAHHRRVNAVSKQAVSRSRHSRVGDRPVDLGV